MNEDTFVFGQLFTQPIQDHNAGGIVGEFVLPVTLSRTMLERSGDVKGYIKLMISHHLASARMDTGVPVEYWNFEAEEREANRYDFPKFLSFTIGG